MSLDAKSKQTLLRSRVQLFNRMSESQSKSDGQELQSGTAVYFSNPLMSGVEADWSVVHDAAFNGRLLVLRSLLRQGEVANLTTLDGVTPLHAACQQGHIMCVGLLIEHGARVNVSTLSGSTPLSEASSKGHVACVNLLLQNGATPQSSSPSTE